MFAAVFAPAAWAHRPNESTAVLRWEHGRLEGAVTLPLALATRLLDDPAVPALRADNFAAARPKLTERLLAGLGVSIAGRVVSPAETVVELNAEGEVQAIVVFPPCAPAALEVRAGFLGAVSPDAFCLVRVWDGADRVLGSRILMRNEPAATFVAPPRTVESTSVPASTANAPASSAPTR